MSFISKYSAVNDNKIDKNCHLNKSKTFNNNEILRGNINSDVHNTEDAVEKDLNLNNEILQNSTIAISLQDEVGIMFQKKNYHKALDFFLKEIKKKHNNHENKNKDYICLKKLKDFEDPIEYFNNSIKLEPNSSSLHTQKGIFLHLSERDEEALICFKNALNLNNYSKSALLKNSLKEEELKKMKNNSVKLKDDEHEDILDLKVVQLYDIQIENFTLNLENLKLVNSTENQRLVKSHVESNFDELDLEIKQLKNLKESIKPNVVNGEIYKSEFQLIRSNREDFAILALSIQKRLDELEQNFKKNVKQIEDLKNEINDIKSIISKFNEELKSGLKDYKKKILNKFKEEKGNIYQKINDYISGFSITLSNHFVCSQVIITDKIQINFNSIPISVITAAAALIPGIGNFCGSALKMINQIIKHTQFKQEAKKILSLSNDAIEFSQITGQLLEKIFEDKILKDSIIDSKKEKIQTEFDSLFDKIAVYVEKKINEVQKFMYKDLYEDYGKKLGFIHADLIIKEIFKESINKENFIEKSLEKIHQYFENKKEIENLVNQHINKEENEYLNKKISKDLSGNVKSQNNNKKKIGNNTDNKCICCLIF